MDVKQKNTHGSCMKFAWNPQAIHTLSNLLRSKLASGTPCCIMLDRFITFVFHSLPDLKHATEALESSSHLENWVSDFVKWDWRHAWFKLATSKDNLRPLSKMIIFFLIKHTTNKWSWIEFCYSNVFASITWKAPGVLLARRRKPLFCPQGWQSSPPFAHHYL